MFNTILQLISQLKEKKPLILNLTNTVTMDFVANGLLSLGASPIMSQSVHEIRDLVFLADSLVINIGTLNDDFVTLCQHACEIANALCKPIVFDPVGAGASGYRTKTCLSLLERYQFATIRGNASEIMALCDLSKTTKGVDTSQGTMEAIDPAKVLSEKYQTIVVISGPQDAVIHQTKVTCYARGSILMPYITGSGCLLTAIISAFQAVHQEKYLAVAAATLFYSVCGEIAARGAKNPGSFKTAFLDVLASLPQRSDYEQI